MRKSRSGKTIISIVRYLRGIEDLKEICRYYSFGACLNLIYALDNGEQAKKCARIACAANQGRTNLLLKY